MRKYLTTAAAVVALSVLGACSSGGSDDAAKETTTTTEKKVVTTTEVPGADVDIWAKGFCTSLGTWLDEIHQASDSADEIAKDGNVDSLKAAAGELYGTMSSATRALIEQIQSQDPPDIENGAALRKDLAERYKAVDDAAVDAQEQIAALPTDDLAAAQAKVDQLGADFQAKVEDASAAITALGAKYPSEELGDAITTSCLF